MKRISGVLLVFSLLGTQLASQTLPTHCTEGQAKSADACAALEVARVLSSRAPDIQRIWPGFWSAAEFALYAPAWGMIARLNAAPPAGFVSIPEDVAGMPRVYGYFGEWPVLKFGGVLPVVAGLSPASSNIGGIEVPTNLNGYVIPVAVQMRPDRLGTIELAIHEAFHSYQLTHFQNMFQIARRPEAPPGAVDSAELPQLAGEAALLNAALSAASAERAALIARYFDLRATRLARNPELANLEREQERKEGTAEYVGLRARLSTTDSLVVLTDTIAARVLSAYQIRHSRRAALQARPYATGAALAYLLDQSGVEWRIRVERGEFLDDLLRSVRDDSQN